ncbi:MAG TPA: MFS transporter [Burkholderiaceae bacterium]|nr:MFS transporter [Burkholderiaceae bacterium]
MTRSELRASASLASIFALRMLGLFLILPVFAVHARGMPGGDDAALIGLALGIYGLTQALLQLPLGIASDRVGRKPVIVAGLLVFALGSFVAAAADSLWMVVAGRALQGAGAISAAVTAFIADSTRDSQRTKAMAMVGGSIGLTFALSLVLAPLFYAAIGMDGIFALTGVLALAGIGVVYWITPPASAPASQRDERTRFRDVAFEPDLMRLNLGIFVLHAVQMAMFVVVPIWLVERAGLPVDAHWKLYLPVVLASFLIMLPGLLWSERQGRMRSLFIGAVALLLLVQLLLALQPSGLVALTGLMLAFFTAFNVLEASLPSLVSRLAPVDAKGAALGIYNTTQSLGLFAGGLLGGALQQWLGKPAVFVACAALSGLWLLAARGHQRWPSRAQPQAA